ncbi:MAG: hypothetical protein H6Q68_3832 [Firmicutes bacterium]|nr:hypothetical protein [Bacillota bacterium]
MDTNNIEILGITPQTEFPNFSPHYPCSQICQIDKLFLACQHDIQKILKVIVSVTICSFKIINTPISKKVIVQGLKHIKVISSIDKQSHYTHSACFDIPFCLYINLKASNSTITKIGTIIEDISLQCLKNQFLLVSIIIFAYPVFKHEHMQDSPDYHNIYHNQYDKVTCNCNKIPHDSYPCPPVNYNACNTPCSYNEADPTNQKHCYHDNQNYHSICPVCQQPIIGYHTYQSYSDD